MNLISKILVSIFGTLALMFLLYLSFFLQDGSQVEKISYPKNTIASATGYYSLSGTTLLASLEKNDESLFGTERLGSMDIVLSTSDTYTVSES
ncbi:MAG: hypothetical protein H6767_08815 [Candidatus Peribacteria bacterium]|nr:MAG: hypothetical protein H6767_08815 [Candidatus Peribacteria bacterium]